jgi:pimeloyl-ACP methyl ester carboxylesterase
MKAAALMPMAELHLVEGVGHFVHLEKSSEVNALIRQFVQ